MITAPQEPCIYCDKRITHKGYFGEQCLSDNAPITVLLNAVTPFRHHDTATRGGPPLHVDCYQCNESKAEVEYLNVDGALEPFCPNCAQGMREAGSQLSQDDPEEFSYA